MLVLSRKINETIIIDSCIKVTITSIDGNKVRIGIEAPPDVLIYREELYKAIQQFAETEADEPELVGAGS